MVWNVEIVIRQPHAVPAHLVYQVFPDNDNLLAAVLNPDRKKRGRSLECGHRSVKGLTKQPPLHQIKNPF